MKLKMHWGAAIATAYITFAVATVSFVIFAIGKPVELVSADYYEQSLKHDTHMRAAANGEALGSAVRVAVVEEARAIDIDIDTDSEARGTITLYRPSDRSADHVVPLSLDAGGHQRIDVKGIARGRWVVKLAWRAGERDFYREQPVLLP